MARDAKTPVAYRVLDAAGVAERLATLPAVRSLLGGAGSQAWRIREVGDGNLNLVFIVEGPQGSVCVKQALPYLRVAGPSWPMSPRRAFFENAYYERIAPHVGALIPLIHHYDAELYCTVMENLSPHIISRHGLIAGRRYPRLARDIGEYVARACFFTSDLAQPFERKLETTAVFAENSELIRITVDLVFTEPYRDSPRNRHTPELDTVVRALRSDPALKVAAARFGEMFLNAPQALVHGDLHTGSIMVTAEDTRVIDPEFAFCGPIGFDLGAFLANLLLNYFAQPGYAAAEECALRRQWLLEQARTFWLTFRERFLALWSEHAAGDAYPPSLFVAPREAAALRAERERFLAQLFQDMLGFGACKMIRRIVGFAHVIDLDGIADTTLRAQCETRALALARLLLTRPAAFDSIEHVLEAAGRVAASQPAFA